MNAKAGDLLLFFFPFFGGEKEKRNPLLVLSFFLFYFYFSFSFFFFFFFLMLYFIFLLSFNKKNSERKSTFLIRLCGSCLQYNSLD